MGRSQRPLAAARAAQMWAVPSPPTVTAAWEGGLAAATAPTATATQQVQVPEGRGLVARLGPRIVYMVMAALGGLSS